MPGPRSTNPLTQSILISSIVMFAVGVTAALAALAYELSATAPAAAPRSEVAAAAVSGELPVEPAPEPSLAEVLQAVRDLEGAGAIPPLPPEPALGEVLKAVRTLESAGLLAPPREPTMKEILLAADALVKAGVIEPPPPSLGEVLKAVSMLADAGALDPPARAQAAAPAPVRRAPAPPPPTSTPVPPPPAADGWFDPAFSSRVLNLINQRRAAAGLAPVSSESRLTRAASDYARLMTQHNWFSHVGPDGSTFVMRITATGFPFDVQLGEILALGQNWSPEGIVQAWVDSASHREQMLEPVYRRAGAGCYFKRITVGYEVRCAVNFAG